jgi:hypothetical protein
MPVSRKPDARAIAAEVIRRANGPNGHRPYVIRLSEPPTPAERLQLIAARLQRTPIAIVPHKCKTADEWLERYGRLREY